MCEILSNRQNNEQMVGDPISGKKEQSIDFRDGKHKSSVYMGARNLISRSSHMRVHLNVCVSSSSIYRYRHAILLHSILILSSFNNILSFHLSLISFSLPCFNVECRHKNLFSITLNCDTLRISLCWNLDDGNGWREKTSMKINQLNDFLQFYRNLLNNRTIPTLSIEIFYFIKILTSSMLIMIAWWLYKNCLITIFDFHIQL